MLQWALIFLVVAIIAGVLGFGGIARIRVVQAPILTEAPARPKPSADDPARRAELEQRLARVEDEKLRALLIELGMGVRG